MVMTAPRSALCLFVTVALFAPAAAMHGFLDSLFHAHNTQEATVHSHNHLGRTVMDALKLAFQLGTSDSQQNVPNADKVFEKYDTQPSDGRLSYEENGALLEDLGFTAAEIQQMQREMDADNDNFIDKHEFNDYIEPPEGREEKAGEEGEPRKPGSNVDETPTKSSEEDAKPQEPTPPPTPAPPRPPTPAWDPPTDYSPGGMPPSPFGNDRAANTLQGVAGRTQDTLVDAVENAQVAEIKRSVFRSLARLRSAQIREFDTIARTETQVIDQYNMVHRYRQENPIRHLADYDDPVYNDKYSTFHGKEPEDDTP